MESLVIVVAVFFLVMLLSPVLALSALFANWHWPAVLLACLALCAGVHWLVHVTTLVRWLGLLASLIGLYVLWNAAPAIY